MYFQALIVIHLGNCQMTQTVSVSDDLNNSSGSEPVLAVAAVQAQTKTRRL